jgi:uncharacterized protein YlxW (UPF0749 family)
MSISAAEKSVEPAAGEAGVSPARRWDRAWIGYVTALSIILGGMLALAVRTTESSRKSATPGSNRFDLLSAILDRERTANSRLEADILRLREQRDGLLKAKRGGNATTDGLNKELADLKVMAGLSEHSGAGIRVTVRDSPDAVPEGADFNEFIVHDQDLNNLIGELKSGGVWQLGISGADTDRMQRIVVTTTARCVGPTAVVNGTPLSAPYHILALGDAKQIRAHLERADGYIRQRGLDAKRMVELTDMAEIKLPEYSGNMSPRYAEPVKPAKPAETASTSGG